MRGITIPGVAAWPGECCCRNNPDAVAAPVLAMGG